MNREIFTLLLDYHRRTFGVWLLLVFVQLMQMSVIWVFNTRHVPIVGAVLASVAFCATWDSPHIVMRTLPIKTRVLALLRWWECIGAPILFIVVAFVLAWFSNDGSHFPTPPFLSLWIPVSASIATLGILAVLPLPMLSAARSNTPIFVVIWVAMGIAGLYGLPMEWLPTPLPQVLLICGSLLALVSLGLARSGRVLQVPPVSRLFAGWRSSGAAASDAPSRFRGWPVLVVRWLRTVVLLAVASIAVVSIVRPHVHLLQLPLPWLFVSTVGAAGAVLSNRWLRSVGALRCLPIRSGTLALIVCLASMAPVVVTSLAATAVNTIVPEWGITVPLYMTPVFAVVPALGISWQGVETNQPVPAAIRQWSPIIQMLVWPLSIGPFMSLALARHTPAWFEIIAMGLGVVIAGVAYLVVLKRIRSGAGFERFGDPLAPR